MFSPVAIRWFARRLLPAALLPGLFGVSHAAEETYVPFRPDLPAGAAYSIDAARLHPTQLCLGWREVVYKRALIEAKSPVERVAYLKDKDVPVVIGPGGVPYLTDGHHTMRALLESKVTDKTTYGHIVANHSALEPAAFWAWMAANNCSYLKDARGEGPQPPAALPPSLLGLQLDPYRGLAWAVMKAGGFHERKVFFQEFLWADYFRSRVAWDDGDDEAFEDAVKAATVLAQAPAAATLPGYRAEALQPRVVTEPTRHDTDDPAIWINPADPAKSLVIGTDKDRDGALYVYDLDGKIVRIVGGLRRPNNVDIATGFALGGRRVDVAATTEREAHRLRVYTLPDMTCVDRGDLVVMGNDPARAPMGIAFYRRPRDGALFVIVGGKSGPPGRYLAQYRLEDDGTGQVKLEFVREFGAYSGKKEIEAIAVDAELGYVYYSDETFGVRKYAADPDGPDAGRELAQIGTTGFASDHEGISIYKHADGTGYLVVSDQQANRFQIFPREGLAGRPHEHPMLKEFAVAAIESDGSEVTSSPLGEKFPHGLFVAMSNGKVFHFYSWDDIAAAGLK